MHQAQLLRSTSGNVQLLTTNHRSYYAAKRMTDLFVSPLLLLFAAPLMLLIALLIKLDSPGPVLFTQERIGRDGRPFKFYKFRSMRPDADPEVHRRYVASLIRDGLPAEAVNGEQPRVFKLTKDVRITRVGTLLRRSSLDELPQLFNVVRGDMSLVGPRPALSYEIHHYEGWHRARLAVIPGITGLWQVHGRSRVTFDEMIQMDLEYIARQSWWLDLKILLLTVPAVLSGNGAG